MKQRDYKSEFNSIVKGVIAPIFKDFGFKKNGNNFYRDFGEFGQAFNIQQSRWNSSSDKSFVFNIGLLDKSIYKETHDLDFPKFPKEIDCNIRLRMGNLMTKSNGWYDLNIGVNISKLKEQIKNEIELYAIPFFEKYKDFNKWVQLLNSKTILFYNPVSEFLFIEKFLGKPQSEIFLNELYNKAIIPRIPDVGLSKRNQQIMRESQKDWLNKITDVAKDKRMELKVNSMAISEINGENLVKAKEKSNKGFFFWIKRIWD
tara:strand:- start:6712 stop:7488 length:777 start_codon:yes stop_codon:yes gene_type:complete